MASFRDRYGAGMLHLLAVLASMALIAYGFVAVFERPNALDFLLWFGGAIVVHDLIAFPLYSALGLVAGRAARVSFGPAEARRLRVMALNHLRVPLVLSAFAFVVWFPLILGLSADRYLGQTGMEESGYLERWLLLTAGLFAVSGVVYAIRLRRSLKPSS